MDSDQVARLLVELGERTPRIESIVQEVGTPRWAIELEDGLIVLAEFDGDRNRLSLETDLGRPPEERTLTTCEALMMFTAHEHTTSGFAMALSEPEGEFQLCGHIFLLEAANPDLQATFVDFTDQARHWREIVARGAQQNSVPANDLSHLGFLA